GTWELLTAAMRVDGSLRGEPVSGLHPGRSAVASISDVEVGFLSELHPAATREFELPGRVAVGELRLSRFLADAEIWTFKEPSMFPPVYFDLAFEVDDDLPSSRLQSAIGEAARPELESVDLFDEFSGPPLAEGSKSLAFRVVLRAPDRTLTQEEIGPIRQRIVAAVSSQLDAKLRGDL
ncbi:MAG: phenylalanine--tRNA ligase subunit beta, partial [Acidimicrobiia bacterium]